MSGQIKGVVDYIYNYTHEDDMLDDLDGYLLKVDEYITIMPSGDVNNADYWNKLASINWHDQLYKTDATGGLLLVNLLGQIATSYEFDYILIDARAGITPLSGLCASHFGDKLAVFFTPSPESLDGTREMLKHIQETRREDGYSELPIVPVLTRYERYDAETDEDAYKADKLAQVYAGTDTAPAELCVIHSDREIERRERVVFETAERMSAIREAPIHADYLSLFTRLVENSKLEANLVSVIDGIASFNNIIAKPDDVEVELEILVGTFCDNKLVHEKLLMVYDDQRSERRRPMHVLKAYTDYCNIDCDNDNVNRMYLNAFIRVFGLRDIRHLMEEMDNNELRGHGNEVKPILSSVRIDILTKQALNERLEVQQSYSYALLSAYGWHRYAQGADKPLDEVDKRYVSEACKALMPSMNESPCALLDVQAYEALVELADLHIEIYEMLKPLLPTIDLLAMNASVDRQTLINLILRLYAKHGDTATVLKMLRSYTGLSSGNVTNDIIIARITERCRHDNKFAEDIRQFISEPNSYGENELVSQLDIALAGAG
jgi:cellulose biosynthesis protein BcsQ